MYVFDAATVNTSKVPGADFVVPHACEVAQMCGGSVCDASYGNENLLLLATWRRTSNLSPMPVPPPGGEGAAGLGGALARARRLALPNKCYIGGFSTISANNTIKTVFLRENQRRLRDVLGMRRGLRGC